MFLSVSVVWMDIFTRCIVFLHITSSRGHLFSQTAILNCCFCSFCFQGCGPKIYSFIRGTKQLQVLRFLGVSIGVAQILAMTLTLTLLWALYYDHKPPDPTPPETLTHTHCLTEESQKPGHGYLRTSDTWANGHSQFEMEQLCQQTLYDTNKRSSFFTVLYSHQLPLIKIQQLFFLLNI